MSCIIRSSSSRTGAGCGDEGCDEGGDEGWTVSNWEKYASRESPSPKAENRTGMRETEREREREREREGDTDEDSSQQ